MSNLILATMRDDDLRSDPWGTAITWAFAVADTLHFRTTAEVPAGLEYRPSPVQGDVDTDSWPDAYVTELLHSGETSPEELTTAALCLDRYLDWCRAAGLDY